MEDAIADYVSRETGGEAVTMQTIHLVSVRDNEDPYASTNMSLWWVLDNPRNLYSAQLPIWDVLNKHEKLIKALENGE